MTEDTVRLKLNELAKIRHAQQDLQKAKQTLVASVMPPVPPEVTEKLKEIDTEFAPNERSLAQAAEGLETEIRQGVLAMGKSIEGDVLRGTFVRPSVKWDAKGLDAYLCDHPEIGKWREVKPNTPRIEWRKP